MPCSPAGEDRTAGPPRPRPPPPHWRGGSGGYAAPTKTAAAALQGGLGGAVLNPRSLVASVRALPEDSFGTGPTGFVIRSVVERFLEPAERVRAVSMRAELGDAAVLVQVEVEAPPGDGEGKAR